MWLKVFPLDRWKSKKLAQREEFSDDEECDKDDEGHKEDEVGNSIEENRRSKSSSKRDFASPKKMNSGEERSCQKVEAETASGAAFSPPRES